MNGRLYFSYRPWYVLLLLYLMDRMTGAGWFGYRNIVGLSSPSLRDMSNRKVQWMLVDPRSVKVDGVFFVCLSSLTVWMTASLLDGILKAWETEKPWRDSYFWMDSSTGLLISSPFFCSLLFSERTDKNHLWILWLCMIREGLFSLEPRTKVSFMSFRVSLTPATVLCLAILENANAFSVRVTGFKHKIYR